VRRIRTALKVGLAGALVGSGIYRLLARGRGPRIHVLGYHRVVDFLVEDGPINPALCITQRTFRRQMEQVAQRFTVLPLSDVVRALTGELMLPAGRDACAVTFDDGYRDVLLRAHPVLEALGIPATVFVPTGYAGSGRFLVHDRLYAALWRARRTGRDLCAAPVGEALGPRLVRVRHKLDEEGPSGALDTLIASVPAGALGQIADGLEALVGEAALDSGAAVLSPDDLRTLAAAGWEIGAHTIGHVVLTHESPARVDDELAEPRLEIERWTGRPCRYFAYCNGLHSRALVDAVRRAGYSAAVTTCDRPNRRGGDPLRISRKVLWEAHARGLRGQWSPGLSAAHLHDVFGDLGLTSPVEGEVDAREDAWADGT
jgi:peptidoglycan/xylan/chitin deacetylase (PgdA/CDA1 family)